jgi:FkbM family methyltransferase
MQSAARRAPPRSPKDRISNYLARKALKHELLELALAAACRRPVLRRRLHVGALALAYARVLDQPAVRVAKFGGYRVCVNVAEHMGIYSFFFGEDLTAWPVTALVEKGSVCADVGANMGVYTFLFGSLVGETGRVVAFEPNPFYASLVEQSIALNGWQARANVDRRALSERSGEDLSFFLSTNPENSGTSSLVNHGVYLNESHRIEVRTVTLDDYVGQHAIERLSVVKIDVERAEDRVLAGMGGLLGARRVDYLIVEMSSQSGAHRTLEGHGYECFSLDATRRALVPVAQLPRDSFGDYVAVNPDKRASFMQRFHAAIT